MFNPNQPYKSICFCGPSGEEKSLQAQETGFMEQYSAAFNQNFAQQQDVLGQINRQLSPVLAKGINQYGFSAPEEAVYDTTAINATAAGVKNASAALGNRSAGMGDSTLESGVQQQLRSGVAVAATDQLSNEQLGIKQAGYAQGRSNYLTALGGLQQLSQAYSPQSYASLTQTAEGQSFGQADEIAKQQSQEEQAIAGGVTSLAMSGLGGVAGSMNGGGFQGFMDGMNG